MTGTTVVAATVTEAQAMAQVSASRTLPEGNYVVPIIARSGKVEHGLNLNITVGPPSDDPNALYLPSIQAQ